MAVYGFNSKKDKVEMIDKATLRDEQYKFYDCICLTMGCIGKLMVIVRNEVHLDTAEVESELANLGKLINELKAKLDQW